MPKMQKYNRFNYTLKDLWKNWPTRPKPEDRKFLASYFSPTSHDQCDHTHEDIVCDWVNVKYATVHTDSMRANVNYCMEI